MRVRSLARRLAGVLLPVVLGATLSMAAPVAPPAGAATAGVPLVPAEYAQLVNNFFTIAGRTDTPGAPDSWEADALVEDLEACFSAGSSAGFLAITERDGDGALGGRVLRLALFDGTRELASFSEVEFADCLSHYNVQLPTDRYHLISGPLRHISTAGIRAADGSYDLFSVTPGVVFDRQYLPGQGWQRQAFVGGGGGPGPSALRMPNGSARVYVTGTNGRLYVGAVTTDRRFLGWQGIGSGRLEGRPYPVLMPDGSVGVYAQGTDHRLWQAVWRPDGSFRGWFALGGPV